MPKPAAPTQPGVHVWLILIKAYAAIEAVASRSIADSNLCPSDFQILEILLHKGALPVNTIGRKIMLTSGSISTAVDRLEKRKLVRRDPSVDDARVTYVSLTGPGHALIQRIFSRHAQRMEDVFDPLSDEERLLLEELLKKVGKHTESLGPAPGRIKIS
ncbi:MAG TPA: MarR family transcriptional regulator [Chthoniobacterales bacterium]|nr:MarR family transcriptional regulator [Chthoniobacterales bacterium]